MIINIDCPRKPPPERLIHIITPTTTTHYSSHHSHHHHQNASSIHLITPYFTTSTSTSPLLTHTTTRFLIQSPTLSRMCFMPSPSQLPLRASPHNGLNQPRSLAGIFMVIPSGCWYEGAGIKGPRSEWNRKKTTAAKEDVET
ncbi:hypothetical protein Pmani_038294 [Petrolisthes manimaculis]|uniref:Uncharacterized protein n=1 Tax=Petrolisthes manimaculis TaxID=1843537 RepID=A0AAE1NGH6_9EUCA|nr:hypothetical protein Pmani_038294 [Petrolisthes manimaculis]